MSGVVAAAARLVLFPVSAAAAGAALAAWRSPGDKVTSAVQHFAAGVVFAALAGELLPELRGEGHLGAVFIGFTVGVGLLLAIGAYGRRQEAATDSPKAGSSGAPATGAVALPLGLLVAVGIDLAIDGLLVGLGATLGSKQGLVLTIALTIEILFLAVSVVAQLLGQGQTRARAALVAGTLGLLTAVGALAGAALFGDASRTTMAAVLAFGAAALLYLVVEELLVEAHETQETPLLAAMFFLGFIGLYAIAG